MQQYFEVIWLKFIKSFQISMVIQKHRLSNQVLTFLFLIFQSYSVSLIYNQNHSTITIFKPNQEALVMKIDFSSVQLHLPHSLKHELQYIYLGRHQNGKVFLNNHKEHDLVNKHILFDFLDQEVQFNDGKAVTVSGKIGLKPQNNAFLELIKISNNQHVIRLEYTVESHQLQVVYESCASAIKFPLSLKIELQGREKVISVKQLSQNMLPDQELVKFLSGQESLIFAMQSEQIEKQVKIVVKNRIQKISLLELMKPFCVRKPYSPVYECNIGDLHNSYDMGGTIMKFDFSICQNGIQIYSNNIEQEESYYFLHCILMILVLISAGFYRNDEVCVKWIKKLLNKKKFN